MIFDRWTYAARVLSVHDGDTVRAEIDLGCEVLFRTTLRVLGIQAPEVSGPGVSPEEKAAGRAARDTLAGLVLNPLGKLYVRTVKDRREGRGRYLASLFLDQGEETYDLAALLVKEGWAIAHEGDGKVPKWIGPGRWRLADGSEVTTPVPPA